MEEKTLQNVVTAVETVTTAVKSVTQKVDGFDTAIKGVSEELSTVKAETGSQLKDITEALKAQSDAIKSIRAVHENSESMYEVIKKQLASEDFKSARANQKDFEFKVKLLVPDFDPLPRSLSSHVVAPGIGQSMVPEYSLTALLTKGTLAARTLYYIDEASYDWTDPTRGVVTEAQSKPGVTPGKFEEHSVSLIKYANSMRVSSEVLWDLDFVTSMINNTLLRDLQRQVEWSFVLGSGNANFKGLTGYKVAYTGTDLNGSIVNPTIIDAILAMALELTLKGFNPDTIVMSPEMYTGITLMKDVNGNYIGQQLMAMLSRFNIVTTVRFSNTVGGNNVAKGWIYMLDSARYNAYNDGSVVIRAGYNADDWITNQQTFVAEQRWLDFMYTRDAGAVMGTLVEDVITALTL